MVIVGTFNVINVPDLPFVLPRMAILATLTGGHGEHDVRLVVEHESTANEIFGVEGPLALHSPLGLADIDLRLENVKFIDEGKHWVMLKDGGETICQRPFFVRRVQRQEGANADSKPAE